MLANLLCWLWVNLGLQLWFKKESLNSDLSRQFLLAILLIWIWFLSWCYQSAKQTLCVGYFTFCQIGVHLVMEQSFKQKICAIYFTKMNSDFGLIWTLNKACIMCYLLYFFSWGIFGHVTVIAAGTTC